MPQLTLPIDIGDDLGALSEFASFGADGQVRAASGLITEDLLPGADSGCGTACAPEPAPAEAVSCCGSSPEPVTIGIGAPAGLGFATGRAHGYSGDADEQV